MVLNQKGSFDQKVHSKCNHVKDNGHELILCLLTTLVKLVVNNWTFLLVMILCSLFEFVMAQTTNRMRGIMMGLVLTVFVVSGMGMYTYTVYL